MTDSNKHRPIRSFVLRPGRMTEGQRRAMEENWSHWGLEHDGGVFEPARSFAGSGPLVLEIGFGMGQSLAEMAQAAPATNFIGIEVHRPGVGKLMHIMERERIENIRIYCDDAVAVLRDCIAEDSVDTIQIFFPDPWHKKRHHKRRLIQAPFIEQLVSRLKPGGRLHLATDWENYAEQMLELLCANPDLSNSSPTGGYVERPLHRPLTKFEKRGQRLGHGVWDLVFSRT